MERGQRICVERREGASGLIELSLSMKRRGILFQEFNSWPLCISEMNSYSSIFITKPVTPRWVIFIWNRKCQEEKILRPPRGSPCFCERAFMQMMFFLLHTFEKSHFNWWLWVNVRSSIIKLLSKYTNVLYTSICILKIHKSSTCFICIFLFFICFHSQTSLVGNNDKHSLVNRRQSVLGVQS